MQNVFRHPVARIVLGAMVVAVLLAVGAACAKKEPTPTPTPAARVRTAPGITQWANQNAKKGGTLRLAHWLSPFSFDVNMASASNPTETFLGPRADKLVRYVDPDPRQIEPSLAERWDISADGKVITFYLRKGVKWHDGTPFTADDVKATLDRIKSPPTGVASARQGWFEPVTSFDVVDPQTLKVNLKSPYPVLLNYLAAGHMGIMQKKALEQNKGDLGGVADWPGTGPFKYVSNTGKESWVLERNPDYWNGDLPLLDGYQPSVIAQEAIGPAMAAGRIDLMKSANQAALELFAREPRIKQHLYGGFFDWQFHMDRSKPPFNDVRVRQALNLIWDRKAANTGVLAAWGKGFSDVGSMWIPTGSGWLDEVVGDAWKTKPGFRAVTDADVAEARRLMTEAGYARGLGTIEVEVRPDLGPLFTVHAEMLEASIKKYLPGTTAFKFKAYDWAESYDRILKGQIQGAMVAFFMGEVDHPAQWLTSFYRTGSGQNFARYSNSELDAILDKIPQEVSRQRVVELSKQSIAILERDLPSIPAGLWGTLTDTWWDYVKDSGCETLISEMNQCNFFDTTWLDK